MTAIAFIFARGGSKGVPGKNIKKLGNKPLIAWSIEQAKAVKKIDRIIVSTDSIEIAKVAIQYGAEVPFLRPVELAQDDSPEWSAWRHALTYLLENEGELPEIMVSVPTTAPLRATEDIENCINHYISGKFDIVLAVTEANRSPYFNMVSIAENGQAKLVIENSGKYTRRQDVPDVFDITTVAYVTNPNFVLSKISIFEGSVGVVRVPKERALDIDTELDFRIAECLIQSNKVNSK
jgi:N-acylneuraminate cytidylyltransferase